MLRFYLRFPDFSLTVIPFFLQVKLKYYILHSLFFPDPSQYHSGSNQETELRELEEQKDYNIKDWEGEDGWNR